VLCDVSCRYDVAEKRVEFQWRNGSYGAMLLAPGEGNQREHIHKRIEPEEAERRCVPCLPQAPDDCLFHRALRASATWLVPWLEVRRG
jgi:hypothetical protein